MKKSKKAKTLLAIICVLAVAVALIMIPHMYIPKISDKLSISSHTERQPLMVAHRGLSSLAPQNSIPAFELAMEYGYDGCELDVHTTKDGKWVVIHNDTIDAMTDGSGRVEDYTLEELKEFKLDSGNGIESYGELKIPTFEEAAETLSKGKTAAIIELKSCDTKRLPELKEIIDKYGLTDNCSIISFEKEYLRLYKEIDPNADLMLLVSVITPDDVSWCVKNGVNTVNFKYLNFYKSIKGWRATKQAGLSLAAWTVDNTVYKDVMVLFGAEIITTNKLIIDKP